MKPSPAKRPLKPKAGEVYPDASIKTLRWSFPDDLARELVPGLVLRLEVIARVDELRDHRDGARWNLQVLEVCKISE